MDQWMNLSINLGLKYSSSLVPFDGAFEAPIDCIALAP